MPNLFKIIKCCLIWHIILFYVLIFLLNSNCNSYGNPITNTIYLGTNSLIGSTFSKNEQIQIFCIIDPYTCFVPLKRIITYTNICH